MSTSGLWAAVSWMREAQPSVGIEINLDDVEYVEQTIRNAIDDEE